MVRHPIRDIYVPVYAGEYAPAECMGRDKYVIDGKEYDECGFCRAACPSRKIFHEPDSGLPLKCDMCEGEEKPKCVEWCLNNALIYEEREEEVEEQEPPQQEVDVAFASLIDKYGTQKGMDTLARLSQKNETGLGEK